jgi:hypothetical protein
MVLSAFCFQTLLLCCAKSLHCAQDMTVYGRDGRAVMVGRQCVAIFDVVQSKL